MALDSVLLERAQRGEIDAVGQLWIEIHRLLTGSFKGQRDTLAKMNMEAADVASVVVLDVLAKTDIRSFASWENFRAFLYLVAHRKFIELYRAAICVRRDWRRTIPIIDVAPDFEVEPIDLAIASEMRSRIDAQLSSRDREILDRQLRGYSTQETGLYLGLSTRTIERHLHDISERVAAQRLRSR